MTITLASILAANAAKERAEEEAIASADRADALTELADTTAALDSTIELLGKVVDDLTDVRARIKLIENSETVDADELDVLTADAGQLLDEVDLLIVDMASVIVGEQLEAELAAEAAAPAVTFNFADFNLADFLGSAFGERPSETVIPRQAAE